MAFHVGQKVVCIKGSNCWYGLTAGHVYTISGMGRFVTGVLYDVAEIKTDIPHAWYEDRFRPVIERKSQTDISIFREILDRETIHDPKVTTPVPKVTHTNTP